MTLKDHYHMIIKVAIAMSVFSLMTIGLYLSLMELTFHPDYTLISKEHPELLEYDALTLLRASRAVQYRDPLTGTIVFTYSCLLAIVFTILIWAAYDELRWIWHLRKLKSKLER